MRSAGACILAAVAILAVAPAVVAGGPAQRGLGGGGLIAFHSCEVYDGYMRSLCG